MRNSQSASMRRPRSFFAIALSDAFADRTLATMSSAFHSGFVVFVRKKLYLKSGNAVATRRDERS